MSELWLGWVDRLTRRSSLFLSFRYHVSVSSIYISYRYAFKLLPRFSLLSSLNQLILRILFLLYYYLVLSRISSPSLSFLSTLTPSNPYVLNFIPQIRQLTIPHTLQPPHLPLRLYSMLLVPASLAIYYVGFSARFKFFSSPFSSHFLQNLLVSACSLRLERGNLVDWSRFLLDFGCEGCEASLLDTMVS